MSNFKVLTLTYILKEEINSLVMLHHTKRSDSHSYGKYNGFASFLKNGESLSMASSRSLIEQVGVEPTETIFRGTVYWDKFQNQEQGMIGHFYLVKVKEKPFSETREGFVKEVPIKSILNNEIPMWPGDQFIMPLLLDYKNNQKFDGVMNYSFGVPTDFKHVFLK